MLLLVNKNIFKLFLVSIIFTSLISCSEDPDLLLKNGKFAAAINIYKKQLSKDYNNSELRQKITFSYFDKASKDILGKKLKSAEDNIEKGIIYHDDKDKETMKRYSIILCDLGQLFIEEGLSNNSKNSDVKNKKLYEKGISLIDKSIKLDGNNGKGKKILAKLNEEKAESYYNSGKRLLNKWFENQEVEHLIFESQINFIKAKELKYSESDKVEKELENIKEYLVKIASKTELYSFKLIDIFFNRKTNILAINLRFFNNEVKGFRAVDPKQFTLYDTKGNKYKPYKYTDELSGYKNVMKRRRLDANRSFKAMLVFDLGKKRVLKFSKLIWVSSKGEIAKKEFPNKNITKIKLD